MATTFLHADNSNLLIIVLSLIILIFTAGLWAIGKSELLVLKRIDNRIYLIHYVITF